MMSVHSKDQTGMKRIFEEYQRMPKNGFRFSCVGLCGTRLTEPLVSATYCELNEWERCWLFTICWYPFKCVAYHFYPLDERSFIRWYQRMPNNRHDRSFGYSGAAMCDRYFIMWLSFDRVVVTFEITTKQHLDNTDEHAYWQIESGVMTKWHNNEHSITDSTYDDNINNNNNQLWPDQLAIIWPILKHVWLYWSNTTRCHGRGKILLFTFFIIHLCNDPCCHRIVSPKCIRAGYFA